MERVGPLRGVWRRGVAVSEAMSLLLPGWGSPVQILPQQQAPALSSASIPRSTLASHFHSWRPVRLHSSHTIRLSKQQVRLLDSEFQKGASSFHGDVTVLTQPKSLLKGNFKDGGNVTLNRGPKKVMPVQYSNKQFSESHRPRGNDPVVDTLDPNVFKPKVPSVIVDQNKDRDFNVRASLDRRSSPSSSKVPKGSTSSEHKRPRPSEDSASDHGGQSTNHRGPSSKSETGYVVTEEALLESSQRSTPNHANSKFKKPLETRVESERITAAHSLSNNHGPHVHGNVVAQLEAPPPQAGGGAAKWMVAAEMFVQNRNPSHKDVGEIDRRRQNTDSVNVELERVGDINELLEIHELEPLSREEEGRSSAVSEGVNLIREELLNAGGTDHSQDVKLSNQLDKEQQCINADVLVVNNSTTAEAVVEELRGQ